MNFVSFDGNVQMIAPDLLVSEEWSKQLFFNMPKTNDQVAESKPFVIEGQQCLVFFLGR